ncbi:germacrene A acid 8-beta-hydroxylase-like [Bidens hawaiensis]|uniref:germacrene A acid 8-beta-hydroxylase-like n=1 Tax=Bidens hawaiensis TaxID=980011 RepID=UPI00404A51BE
MEPFTVFSIVASSLILYTCWTLLTANTAKNLSPGPPKLPLIGNIHLLDKQRPHRKLTHLARKYGPIMHLQLGQVSTVVISSPQLTCEILKIQDINFADRRTTPTAHIFFYKGSNIGWAPYGNYWRQLKKFATLELLSAKKVRSFFYIREDELTRVFKFLESTSGAPINFREAAREVINNMVSRATLGDVCKDRKRLLDCVYFMLKTFSSFNMTNYYPRLNFLNIISGKKAKWLKMHKEIDVILENILEEHRSKPRSIQDHEDIVDMLLRVKDTGTNQFDLPLTNDRIKAIILEMLTAGTSSSSMTIEWAFCEMMRNPEIMKKAQSEVRAVVKGGTITEADVQMMNYMKLVVKETMRLHGVPILLPRENPEDCVVDGYHIPARTRILVNAWACATDPNIWENPHRFIPERFENSSIGFSGSDFEFLPFGAGRRMCPGMNFGLGTVEYVIASLLHRFDWKLPEGVKPGDLDMRELTTISTVPTNPLHIVPIPISKQH